MRVTLFESPLNAIEMRNAIRPYSAALARGVSQIDHLPSGSSHGGQVIYTMSQNKSPPCALKVRKPTTPQKTGTKAPITIQMKTRLAIDSTGSSVNSISGRTIAYLCAQYHGPPSSHCSLTPLAAFGYRNRDARTDSGRHPLIKILPTIALSRVEIFGRLKQAINQINRKRKRRLTPHRNDCSGVRYKEP